MRHQRKQGTGRARQPWWSVLRRTPSRPATVPDELFLSSTGSFVAVDEALGDACLATVVVDDLVWRIAVEDWHARQPPHRWSPRDRWLDEYDALSDERARITTVARFYGAAEPRRR